MHLEAFACLKRIIDLEWTAFLTLSLLCVCVFIYTQIYIYMCVYICTYIHIHISRSISLLSNEEESIYFTQQTLIFKHNLFSCQCIKIHWWILTASIEHYREKISGQNQANMYCLVGWSFRIHQLLLCRWVRLPQRVSCVWL